MQLGSRQIMPAFFVSRQFKKTIRFYQVQCSSCPEFPDNCCIELLNE